MIKLHQQHGPIFKLIIASAAFIVTEDPELGKLILSRGEKILPKADDIVFKVARTFFGDNIFLSNRENWPRHHQLVNPAFTDKAMSYVIQVSQDMTRLFMKNVESNAERSVMDDMSYISADVIGHAGFDYDFKSVETNGQSDKLIEATRTWLSIQNLLRVFPLWCWLNLNFGVFAKVKESTRTFKSIVNKLIETRRRALDNDSAADANNRRDILSLLLKGSSSSADESSTATTLSPDELLSNIRIFLIAGHETTARTLGFAMYLLATNIEVQRHAQSLADQIKKQYGEELTLEVLMNAPEVAYFKNIMKETLRIYPVAIGILRQATEEIKLKNVVIEKNVRTPEESVI